jgi:hypothetical protein
MAPFTAFEVDILDSANVQPGHLECKESSGKESCPENSPIPVVCIVYLSEVWFEGILVEHMSPWSRFLYYEVEHVNDSVP